MTRTMLLAARLTDEAISAPSDRDCCVYAHAVLRRWTGLPLTGDMDLWRIWREPDGSIPARRVWGPVSAAVIAGIGERRPTDLPVLGRWHICQGWRNDPLTVPTASGHTWLWRQDDAEGRGVWLQYDATRGPRLGLATWSAVAAPYRYGVAVAALRRGGE